MTRCECRECKTIFHIRTALFNRGQGFYCTSECFGKANGRLRRDESIVLASAVRVRCNRCAKISPPESFYRKASGAIIRTCKNCTSKDRKEYAARTGSKKSQQSREARRKSRKELVAALGGRCSCCGESHFSMLDIDHVHGNGRAHRESLGHQWHKVFRDIKDNLDSGLYQLLCSNCNQSKRRLGECEHKWPKAASIQN